MSLKNVLQCSKSIAAKGWTISFLESATAGRMCYEFSLTPHSGDILRGGISCYEVFIKEHIIKVPHKLIEEYTPESAEVTKALAEHGAKLFKSDVTVAVTGLTSPGGSETVVKPVGSMFIHILLPYGFITHGEVYKGNAEEIVLQVINTTALLIIEELKSKNNK